MLDATVAKNQENLQWDQRFIPIMRPNATCPAIEMIIIARQTRKTIERFSLSVKFFAVALLEKFIKKIAQISKCVIAIK